MGYCTTFLRNTYRLLKPDISATCIQPLFGQQKSQILAQNIYCRQNIFPNTIVYLPIDWLHMLISVCFPWCLSPCIRRTIRKRTLIVRKLLYTFPYMRSLKCKRSIFPMKITEYQDLEIFLIFFQNSLTIFEMAQYVYCKDKHVPYKWYMD